MELHKPKTVYKYNSILFNDDINGGISHVDMLLQIPQWSLEVP
jgi:hypothetical protein